MSSLESDVLEELITSSIRTSANRFYHLAAALPSSPSVYDRFRSWLKNIESGDSEEYRGNTVIKKVINIIKYKLLVVKKLVFYYN